MALKLKRPASELLTTKQAADMLNLSTHTLYTDRSQANKGGVLQYPYIKLGTTVRYKRSDLDALIEASRVE